MKKEPITINYLGNLEESRKLNHMGLQQLSILRELMSFRDLKQNRRVLNLEGGGYIECTSVFGINKVNIFIPYPFQVPEVVQEESIIPTFVSSGIGKDTVLCWILWGEIPWNYEYWKNNFGNGFMMPANTQDDLFRVYLKLNPNGTVTWYNKTQIESLGYDTKDPWNLRQSNQYTIYGTPEDRFLPYQFEIFKNRGRLFTVSGEASTPLFSRQFLLSFPDKTDLSVVIDEISLLTWTTTNSKCIYFNYSLAKYNKIDGSLRADSWYNSEFYNVNLQFGELADDALLTGGGTISGWEVDISCNPNYYGRVGFRSYPVNPGTMAFFYYPPFGTLSKFYQWSPGGDCYENMWDTDNLLIISDDLRPQIMIDYTSLGYNIGKSSEMYIQDFDVRTINTGIYFVQLRLRSLDQRDKVVNSISKYNIDPADDVGPVVVSFTVTHGTISDIAITPGFTFTKVGTLLYSTETEGRTIGHNSYIGTRILTRVNVDSQYHNYSIPLRADIAWNTIKVPANINTLLTAKATEKAIDPLVWNLYNNEYISGYNRTVNGPYLVLPKRI